MQETAEIEIQEIIANAVDKKDEVDKLNAFSHAKRNFNPNLSLEIAEKAFQLASLLSYLKGKADALLNLGFCSMQISKHEAAYKFLFDALPLYSELDDEAGIANVEYTIGVIHLRIGNFDESVTILHKSLERREKLGDKQGIASCYFQLSYVNMHFNDEEGLEENVRKSLQLRKEINDRAGIAASLMVLAEFYIRRKELVKARETIEESLEIRKEIGEKLGYFASFLRYAEICYLEKNYELARTCSFEGKKMAAEENVHFGILRFLQILAKVEFSVGNFEESKKYQFEALEIGEKYSFKSMLYELHETLAEVYKQEDDYKSALDHYEKFIKGKEEVINFQSNTRLKSQQLINQIESAQREAELERAKNDELQVAYSIIEEKNKDITDSIHYAKRIQNGFLPGDEELSELLDDYFVFYKPRDIVSGDFYWATNVTTTNSDGPNSHMIILAAVDCTGHGVPGAFMSILGNMLINQTIRNPEINSPADALNYLNRELPKNLKAQNRDETIRDGMDMSMVAIDKTGMKLFFAAANNPVYIIRRNQLIELKGDKQAISGSEDIPKYDFTNQSFTLEKGDAVYLFTDGFADQFGGPKGKKFKYKQFQEKLTAIGHRKMNEQKIILEETFENWKGNLEQVDDVLVIGVRI